MFRKKGKRKLTTLPYNITSYEQLARLKEYINANYPDEVFESTIDSFAFCVNHDGFEYRFKVMRLFYKPIDYTEWKDEESILKSTIRAMKFLEELKQHNCISEIK